MPHTLHIAPILYVTLFCALVGASSNCKGCLSLDEYNFDKLLRRFKVVLVKFDVVYPFGDKHELFSKLAEELAPYEDVALGEVPIKDYGEKDNEALGLRYGVKSKDDFPSLRLFVQGKNQPVAELKNSDEWSLNSLRNLIRDNTDVYVGLPGCLEKFDKLAMKFIGSEDKAELLKRAEKAAQELKDEQKQSANTYLKFMRKILESGKDFVDQERTRLNKILKEGKVSEKKKTELSNRLNILRSFSLPNAKDEL